MKRTQQAVTLMKVMEVVFEYELSTRVPWWVVLIGLSLTGFAALGLSLFLNSRSKPRENGPHRQLDPDARPHRHPPR
jgi:hypothetical protein